MARQQWVKTAVVALLVLIIAGGFVSGVIPFLWIVGSNSIKEAALRVNFDSAGWKNPKSTSGEFSVRQRMVNNLIAQNRLIGLTKRQVTDLLGQPEFVVHRECYYDLGLESGWLKIDNESLVLEFDSHARVIGVERHVN